MSRSREFQKHNYELKTHSTKTPMAIQEKHDKALWLEIKNPVTDREHLQFSQH
jgi:hypothetical protein